VISAAITAASKSDFMITTSGNLFCAALQPLGMRPISTV
jgi:hypothetical protein